MATSKAKVIELERGLSLRQVLIDTFTRTGSLTGVAKELGVTQGTVSLWLQRCNLEIKTTLVEKETAQ